MLWLHILAFVLGMIFAFIFLTAGVALGYSIAKHESREIIDFDEQL